jgi:hypothetical protein
MSVIQIVVPVTHDKLHLLEDCLHSIKQNTPVDHVVNVAIGQAMIEDKIGEIVATARAVYDRAGLVITCCDPKLGYNGIVMEVLRTSDFQYTLVLPVTHRIVDHEWFGKMQLPMVRAPMCAMTFAPDDEPANTRAAHPWEWRRPIPSKVFMLSRASMGTARAAAIDLDGEDLANAIRDQLRSVGANCWAVPSCRLGYMMAEWK